MHRKREAVWFAVLFVILSLALGWIFWNSTSAQVGVSMLGVPVISAMLASQGFTWKRKLVYAAATLALYLLGTAIADATGLIAAATEYVNAGTSFPSLWVLLYMAYLTAFPFVMLVLFAGRNPSLLWSKGES